MIYDTLDHIGQYSGISPQLDLALTVLRETDFSAIGHILISSMSSRRRRRSHGVRWTPSGIGANIHLRETAAHPYRMHRMLYYPWEKTGLPSFSLGMPTALVGQSVRQSRSKRLSSKFEFSAHLPQAKK